MIDFCFFYYLFFLAFTRPVAEEAVTDPVRRRILGRSIDRRRGMS
jgi:hypothetical protein